MPRKKQPYSRLQPGQRASEAGVIEPGETADDWQLIAWIIEADEDSRYQAHCADFYSW